MKAYQKKYNFLLFSLLFYYFIPFILDMIQMHLLSNHVEAISIVGNIEWFDLINETVQGFLIIPLYYMFSQYKKRKESISNGFVIANVIYLLFSIVVYLSGSSIVHHMNVQKNFNETIQYLQLETIAFVIANVFAVSFVVFVVIGKAKYVYLISIVQIISNLIGYQFLIPSYAANGVAYTKILTNILSVFICLYMLKREQVLHPIKLTASFLKEYCKVGIFSGGQVFLDNIMYGLLVCRMVNQVQSQGVYWVANNLIWGFFLIPCNAISEIIKREKKISVKLMKWIAVSFIFWIPFILKADTFLKFVVSDGQIDQVRQTLFVLLPFYIVYVIANSIDSMFVGQGKTWKLFIISFIVNLIYYPICYLILKGHAISLTQICIMFGGGMIAHCIIDFVFVIITKCKKINE